MPLLTAREWGVPPWEVTGEKPTATVRRKWFLRWRVYYGERTRAMGRKNRPATSPSPWGPEWD